MDNKALIRTKLREMVARDAEIPAEELEDDVNVGEYGLDSVSAVSMIGEMQSLFDAELSPTMMYENPTIDELVDAIDRASRPAAD